MLCESMMKKLGRRKDFVEAKRIIPPFIDSAHVAQFSKKRIDSGNDNDLINNRWKLCD